MNKIPVEQITTRMLKAAAEQANPGSQTQQTKGLTVLSGNPIGGIVANAVPASQTAHSVTQTTETAPLSACSADDISPGSSAISGIGNSEQISEGIETVKPEEVVSAEDDILLSDYVEGWEAIRTMDLDSIFLSSQQHKRR